MLRLVHALKDAKKEAIEGAVIEFNLGDPKETAILSVLKGELIALDQVLEIKELLNELTEEEVNSNEVTSDRT